MSERSSRRAARRDTPEHAHRILDRAYDLLNDAEALIEAAARGPLDLTVLQAQMAATRASLTAAVNAAASESVHVVAVSATNDTVNLNPGRKTTTGRGRGTSPTLCGYQRDTNSQPCEHPAVDTDGACREHLFSADADRVLHEVATLVQRELDVDDAVARHVDQVRDMDETD